jgi:hypothetical protein
MEHFPVIIYVIGALCDSLMEKYSFLETKFVVLRNTQNQHNVRLVITMCFRMFKITATRLNLEDA